MPEVKAFTPEMAMDALRAPGRCINDREGRAIAHCISTLCKKLKAAERRPLESGAGVPPTAAPLSEEARSQLHAMAMDWQARAGRLEARSDEGMQAAGSQLQECSEELVEALLTLGVEGIDGPRHGPVADGSQKPNDAAAIPCAKAGSNSTVACGVLGTPEASDETRNNAVGNDRANPEK